MGETHGFRMGCNELFHLFEWVHRTAGWVVKFSNGKHERSHGSLTHSNGFIERLNGLSSFLNGKHEQANSSLTRSNGFIERLNALLSFLNGEQTSDRLTQPFERVYRKTEQVIKFFWTANTKGQMAYQPVWTAHQNFQTGSPNDWEAYTDNYLSKQSHFTRGCPVSPGMKLLLHRINNNYCLRTCISIWDCNFSKNYIRKTPQLC